MIALGLRNTQDPRAIDALVAAAKSKYQNPSHAATTALIAVEQQPRIFDAFAKALESGFANVMNAAAKGLASYNDPRAVTLIFDRLRNLNEAYIGWKDGALCVLAIMALGHPAEPRVEETLVRLTSENDEGTREGAKTALKELRKSFGDLKQAARKELAEIKHPRKIDVLIRGAEDPDPAVRMLAAMALGQMHDPKGEASLVTLVSDQDDDVRTCATTALSQFRQGLQR